MDKQQIVSFINENMFGIWFLIGAALVFWMQAGFAMVETGFTRAKNAGNILMKNLMDFCIGTVMFILIGFSLLLGEDVLGFIGKPGFDIFTSYANFDFSNFVFNLVFCATTATIVSGAMAERTKFLSYCIYSAVISALIYPIEAHWIWGGGWLSQLGFHDFAGSCAIHMVGGISALIGAAMLGPRIGKFSKDKSGKITKVNAFPGHNLPLGCLGCFILWFGWYGFNGAACTSGSQLASVFLTTTVAPAVATVVCMIFTWLKYGKPDVSMCLNASLAGLVAITAGCDTVSPTSAAIIGIASGFIVVFGIEFIDKVLKIDDPVGAVGVHGLNGAFGTLAVGLFSDGSGTDWKGLLTGGGFHGFGVQFTGMIITIAWVVVTMTIIFQVIKHTIGLRVSAEEEIAGLDSKEHGLASAYDGFAMAGVPTPMGTSIKAPVVTARPSAPAESVPELPKEGVHKLTKVVIITRQNKLDEFMQAMNEIGVTGITITNVLGCGVQKGAPSYYRGVEMEMNLLPKVKIEIVVSLVPVQKVIETAKAVLHTGQIGDGKVFVYDIENVVKIRTGEEGYLALQDTK